MRPADEFAMVKTVREYYRENFNNGESDESFVLWIENVLEEMNENDEA